MHITKITDHYGAWELLQTTWKKEYDEINEVIEKNQTIPLIFKPEPKTDSQNDSENNNKPDLENIAKNFIPSLFGSFLIPIAPVVGLTVTAIGVATGFGLNFSDIIQKKKSEFIRSDLNDFTKLFILKNWNIRPEIESETFIRKNVDFIKNELGVELCFGPSNLLLNSLFFLFKACSIFSLSCKSSFEEAKNIFKILGLSFLTSAFK